MRNLKGLVMIFAALLLILGVGTPHAHGATNTIMVGNYFFSPKVDTVTKGDTVVWIFVTGIGTLPHTTSHNVLLVDRIWDSGFIFPGESFTKVFDTVGTFPYLCDLHPLLMLATLVVKSSPSGIEIGADTRPSSSTLYDNYPNPFNAGTTIRFELKRPTMVEVSIYNALGRRVITLLRKMMPVGYHRVDWNGKDHRGHDVPSGVYLYRITENSGSEVKKMVLLR